MLKVTPRRPKLAPDLCKTAPDCGCLLETSVSIFLGAQFCVTAEKHKRIFGYGFAPIF